MNKYSDIEIQTAKILRDEGYKWLARTMVGNVVAFSHKPYKSEGFWLYTSNSAWINGKVMFIYGKITPFFQGIRFEDDEPTYIEDIIKPQILDDVERRYLSAVIRPFKNQVRSIVKHYSGINSGKEYLVIITDGCWMRFPDFDTGTMYKGMEIGRRYTPEELGL